MRTENGVEVPATLGEYRDLVAALTGADCNKAVEFLDEKIAAAEQGRDACVAVSDLKMRTLLMPMIADSLGGPG